MRRGHRAEEPDAETIAIAALSYLATETDELARFLAVSGLEPTALRETATSPAFLIGLLDFILEDDRRVIALAEAQGIAPEAVVRARNRFEARRTSVLD